MSKKIPIPIELVYISEDVKHKSEIIRVKGSLYKYYGNNKMMFITCIFDF